jgi:RNA polymerase sigma-70 factor (ECF subfamily)
MRKTFEREALPLLGVLYAGALRLTRNARDAEDLVQDTMVRAFEKFHLYRQGTNLKAWLFRVMMNRFINLYRRRKAAPDRASFEDVGEFLGHSETLRAQDFASARAMAELMRDKVFLDSLDDRLKRALEGLGEDYRQILILNVIGDMPYKDIAQALDIPIGTVMSRLSRAKSLLRERVAELGREIIPGVGIAPEHASKG